MKIVIIHPYLGVHLLFGQFSAKDGNKARLDIGMTDARGHFVCLLGVGLILRRERGNVNVAFFIFPQKFDQIIRITVKKFLAHIPAAQISAGFHPAGRTPRRSKQIDVRPYLKHFFYHGNDIFSIPGDGEMSEFCIIDSIIVRVKLRRIVTGTDRQAANRKIGAVPAVNRFKQSASAILTMELSSQHELPVMATPNPRKS